MDFFYSEVPITIIDYDRIEAARMAVQHFIKNGHEKIGFIGGGVGAKNDDILGEKRYQGYKKAMGDAGVHL